jgi:hypothetical protein
VTKVRKQVSSLDRFSIQVITPLKQAWQGDTINSSAVNFSWQLSELNSTAHPISRPTIPSFLHSIIQLAVKAISTPAGQNQLLALYARIHFKGNFALFSMKTLTKKNDCEKVRKNRFLTSPEFNPKEDFYQWIQP